MVAIRPIRRHAFLVISSSFSLSHACSLHTLFQLFYKAGQTQPLKWPTSSLQPLKGRHSDKWTAFRQVDVIVIPFLEML